MANYSKVSIKGFGNAFHYWSFMPYMILITKRNINIIEVFITLLPAYAY